MQCTQSQDTEKGGHYVGGNLRNIAIVDWCEDSFDEIFSRADLISVFVQDLLKTADSELTRRSVESSVSDKIQ